MAVFTCAMGIGAVLREDQALAVFAQAELTIGYGRVHRIHGFLHQRHAGRKRHRHAVAAVSGHVRILRDERYGVGLHRGIFHRHRQRCILAVAVRIRDAELEAVTAVCVGIRGIGIGTVGVHLQRAAIALHFHRAAFRQRQFLTVHRDRLHLGKVRPEVVRPAACRRRGTGVHSAFKARHADGRAIVLDGHGDGAARRGAVHVRHRHGKVMGNLRVRGVGIVLRGVAGKLVGELQLTRVRVEARHRQDAFIRGNRVAREITVFKHGHVADLDAGHAVGRIDIQRTGCRGGRTGLPGLRAVVKTGFVDRQRLGTGFGVTRRHHDAVVHAVDGDGHLALGHVAVGVGVGVGDLFRPRVAVGERLHLRVVIVELIDVGAVFVQREFAVPALLTGIRPRKVRAIRTGHSALKGIADDGIGIPFRHRLLKALDGGHVVGDLDTDHGRAAVAVRIRHHHCHFVGDGIVFAASV